MGLKAPNRILAIVGILILLGILAAVTPWYIFPVCEICEKSGTSTSGMPECPEGTEQMSAAPGSHMTCWYTGEAEVGIGALIILAGLTLIALPGRDSRRALGIVGIGLGALVALIPTVLIGTCSGPSAPCNIGTKPALIILGVLTVIVGIYLVLSKDTSNAAPN